MTIVLPLGLFSTQEGPGHALLALEEDGPLHLHVGASWAAAAEALAKELSGPVTCDPALTVVARRHGWAIGAPDQASIDTRAMVALSLALSFPPAWSSDVEQFIQAWRAFYPMKLWEQLPAEMALPLLRTREGKVARQLVSVLGQSGLEFGMALYQDPDDFDRLHSGERPRGQMLSVLSDQDEPSLRTAFEALGVPAPILSAAKGLEPRELTHDDLRLATAAMKLLVGITTGTIEVQLGLGDRLEFERNAPRATKKKPARTVKKAKVKPPPAAKKKAPAKAAKTAKTARKK